MPTIFRQLQRISKPRIGLQSPRRSAPTLARASQTILPLVASSMLLALGCSQPSSSTAQSDSEASKLGQAKSALTAKAVSKTGNTFWVVLKEKASLNSARSMKDWKTRGTFVSNELQATAERSQADLISWLTEHGVSHRAFWIANVVKVTADDETIELLRQRKDVKQVKREEAFKIAPLQPGAKIKPLDSEWGGQSIRAPEVWEQFGTRGEGIVVANIDTGVDYLHPALSNQYRGNNGDGSFEHSYNWYQNTDYCPGEAPCDTDQHGTHTMGTIAGEDGETQIGIAPDAEWIAALGCPFGGCPTEDLLSTGEWILAPTDASGENARPDLRPHVVNNSWGGGQGDFFYQEIVQAWVSAGIFPVFSAGNAGRGGCGTVNSPSDYPESYSVAAYDEFDQIADFSSRGPSVVEGVSKPEIAAPGVDVLSSVPGGGYQFFSGTSMAAPHVAGTIALMWSAAPALIGDIDATRALLGMSALNVDDDSCGGDAEFNGLWGEGKLDAFAAVDLSPRGPTGYLVGRVLTNAGLPLAGAAVHATNSEVDRATRTNAEGDYSLRLPIGDYQVDANAFRYLASAPRATPIAEEVSARRNFRLRTAPLSSLSGLVSNVDGQPLPGVLISLANTPIEGTRTDEEGRYTFAEVPHGDYRLRVDGSGCFDATTQDVVVAADASQDFELDSKKDEFGNTCRLVDFAYVEASDLLPLAGDDNTMEVDLPFAFPFYEEEYDSISVTTNGYLTFANNGFAEYINSSIPSSIEPNAALYPFWDDLYVEGAAAIYTQSIEDESGRSFVVEYRDVPHLADFSQTVSFEVVLHENGTVDFVYKTPGGSELQSGLSATIGLENPDGTDAFQFSHNSAFLQEQLAVRFSPPPLGSIAGVITDTTDGQVLAGVTVNANVNGDLVRSTRTDALGQFRLRIPVGSLTLEATKDNYSIGSFETALGEGDVIESNFALDTAAITVSEHTLQLTIEQGQLRSRSLTIGNVGQLGMDFEILEAGGNAVNVLVTRKLATTTTLPVGSRNSRALFPEGFVSQASVPQAVGEIISEFSPDVYVSGIGKSATHLWLASYDCDQRNCGTFNHEYTLQGEATGTVHYAGEEYFGMAYDSTRQLMCQIGYLYNFGNSAISCWNLETGEVEVELSEGAWTNRFLGSLAYDPEQDVFYASDYNQGVLKIAGSTWETPGEELSSCEPADSLISGLAWNSSAQVLWAATNSPDDTLYQLEPSDCTVLGTLAHPGTGSYRGGNMTLDEDGNLWMQNQSTGSVLLVDSGVPTIGDVSWLAESPQTGIIGSGGSVEVEISIDTNGLEPGQYLGSLVIRTNSGKNSTLRIPVSLLVPAYLQAVNSGGSDYVDTSGELWSSDQSYESGSWGYVGQSFALRTLRSIDGSSEQGLHQFQRMGLYAYRFDDVPNGIYEVELEFAEIEKRVGFGERLFDLILENQLTLPAYDIAYEVGSYSLDSHRYFVEVEDGQLDIRLVGQAGTKPPVINGLRVTHRPDR